MTYLASETVDIDASGSHEGFDEEWDTFLGLGGVKGDLHQSHAVRKEQVVALVPGHD